MQNVPIETLKDFSQDKIPQDDDFPPKSRIQPIGLRINFPVKVVNPNRRINQDHLSVNLFSFSNMVWLLKMKGRLSCNLDILPSGQ